MLSRTWNPLRQPRASYTLFIVLPKFDKDEYVNQPKGDKDATDATVVPSNEVANLEKEAGVTVTEASGEKTT